MSEDLFANPHSQIPDELWKTPSPMERQLAAVEYWAELTQPEKTAAGFPVAAIPVGMGLAGAGVGGAFGATLPVDPELLRGHSEKEREQIIRKARIAGGLTGALSGGAALGGAGVNMVRGGIMERMDTDLAGSLLLLPVALPPAVASRMIAKRESERIKQEKSASADGRKYVKMKDFVRSRKGQIGLAAGLTGAIGAGSSLYSSRKDEKGLTRSQKKLLQQEAALNKKEELSGKTRSTHRERKLLELRKKLSDLEARNPKASAAGQGAAGAAIGGALMRRQLRSGS